MEKHRIVVYGVLAGVTAFLLFHLSVLFSTSSHWPPSSSAAATEVILSSSTSMTPQPRIAVLSTVLKLYNVRVYDQLDAWCESFPALDIYILYRQRGDVSLPHCAQHRLHLIVEPDHVPENRIDRLAVLRNVLRETVRNSQQPYDAVMVIDLDMYRIPTVAQLQQGLERVVARAEDHDHSLDIACANGYEVMAGMKQPYDLYAMIEASGDFRYGAEGLTPYWYATLQQPRIYQSIVQSSPQVYPVQSCFAGLAIYKASLYFDERCSYTERPEPLDRFTIADKVCEHVVLHQCLHHYYDRDEKNVLRAAILPTMPVQRACEAACHAIGSLYVMAVYGGSLLTAFVALRWKRHHETLASTSPARKLF